MDMLKQARKHIESLYFDTCNIIERQRVKDADTCITSWEEITVFKNVPCKLSNETVKATGEGVSSSLILSVKLILSPDLDIKAGSKIEVTRNGKTTIYKNSGEPARHFNHQEIILELWDDWA